jgi:hypothetical protein
VRSLSNLFTLAYDFQVSTAAMANRLRELSLSHCRLQVWQRGSSGAFLFTGSSTTADLWAGLVPLVEDVSGGRKFGNCGGRNSDSRQHGVAAG